MKNIKDLFPYINIEQDNLRLQATVIKMSNWYKEDSYYSYFYIIPYQMCIENLIHSQYNDFTYVLLSAQAALTDREEFEYTHFVGEITLSYITQVLGVKVNTYTPVSQRRYVQSPLTDYIANLPTNQVNVVQPNIVSYDTLSICNLLNMTTSTLIQIEPGVPYINNLISFTYMLAPIVDTSYNIEDVFATLYENWSKIDKRVNIKLLQDILHCNTNTKYTPMKGGDNMLTNIETFDMSSSVVGQTLVSHMTEDKDKLVSDGANYIANDMNDDARTVFMLTDKSLKSANTEQNKQQIIDYIASDIISTGNVDKDTAGITYAAYVSSIGAENKDRLDSAIKDKFPTEGTIEDMKTTTGKVKKDENINKSQIDATSATATNIVDYEKITEIVNEAVKRQVGVNYDNLLKELELYKSAALAALSAQGVDIKSTKPEDLYKAATKVSKATRTAETQVKSPSKQQKSPSKQQKPPRVSSTKLNNRREMPKPVKKEVTPKDDTDVDYTKIHEDVGWKNKNLLMLYFIFCGAFALIGLPFLSAYFFIPSIIFGMPCAYYFYGRACFNHYISIQSDAGIKVDRLSVSEMLKSKPYVLFGGSLCVACLASLFVGSNLLSNFYISVVFVGVVAAIYFGSHFAAKDLAANITFNDGNKNTERRVNKPTPPKPKPKQNTTQPKHKRP